MSGAAPLKTEPQVAPQASGLPEPSIYSRDFWLVFAASFALNSAANLFVLFPLWIVQLGGGASAIGAIIGTGSLAALAVRPVVGVLIDRRGCKQIALVFLILNAFAMAMYIATDSLGWQLFAVRALQGAFEGTARVALFAMVYDLLPRGREGEAMATFSLCGMGPAAITPLLGEVLIRHWGFHAFFALAIFLSVAGVVATTMVPDDRPVHKLSDQPAPPTVSYASVLFDRTLAPLWIVTFLFSLSLSARFSFVAPYAYQVGIERVGWYFALYSIAAVFLRLFGGRFIDRLGPERIVLPSLVVLSIGLGLIATASLPWMLDVAAVIGGVGHGLLYPALSALVIGRTQANAMGRSSSVYTSLYDAGIMAGPYLLGAFAGILGYVPMFIASASLAFVAAVYFAAVEPRALRRRLA
ncbi:MAG: MFS transporter [Candidatus Binataceae bacterium]